MSELIDNRANRLRTLKQIILKLHAGEPADSVKADLAQIVRETDYSDIVAMEQELMADGMPVEEVQCMCDLHSQVTREVLVPAPPRVVPHGHPANTLRRENDALRVAILRMREAMSAIKSLPDTSDADAALYDWRLSLNQLMDVDKHYARKENLFFTCLEKYGVTGPSKVMWAKDDEVRAKLKTMALALHQTGVKAGEWKMVAATVAADALAAIEEMFYKEENILLPICFEHFTEDDWASIWSSSPRYGWCLVEPLDEYRPPEKIVIEAVPLKQSDAVQLPTGNLSLKQLRALFETLPVDLTYVDADDRVAFFSEGPDRIFSRSKAIIGRKVQHCHPPKSVDTVDRILADFREGRQDVAEFWINFQGRFVHIRYFAVRDAGEYLGCLEVTQEVTKIRALQGERRLLQYEGVTA